MMHVPPPGGAGHQAEPRQLLLNALVAHIPPGLVPFGAPHKPIVLEGSGMFLRLRADTLMLDEGQNATLFVLDAFRKVGGTFRLHRRLLSSEAPHIAASAKALLQNLGAEAGPHMPAGIWQSLAEALKPTGLNVPEWNAQSPADFLEARHGPDYFRFTVEVLEDGHSQVMTVAHYVCSERKERHGDTESVFNLVGEAFASSIETALEATQAFRYAARQAVAAE